MNKSNYSVDVLVNNRPVKQFGYQGKTYIEGKSGSAYQIRVKNHSSSRVLAVISIDGIDILSGTAACKDSGGYVISAYDSYTASGFRTSNETVAPFEFARKSESYAAKSDEPDVDISNCGVIGCIIFPEKQPKVIYRDRIKKEYVPYPYPIYSTPDPWKPPYSPWEPNPHDPIWYSSPTYSMRSSMGDDSVQTRSMNLSDSNIKASTALDSFYTTDSAEGNFTLGTKFSDSEVRDVVTTTTFERSGVSYKFEIFYATRRSLENMGVFNSEPSISFPQSFTNEGFCKRPKC